MSDARRCPLCGADNQCARAIPGDTDAKCWCFDATLNSHAVEQAQKLDPNSCICPRCAAPANSATDKNPR